MYLVYTKESKMWLEKGDTLASKATGRGDVVCEVGTAETDGDKKCLGTVDTGRDNKKVHTLGQMGQMGKEVSRTISTNWIQISVIPQKGLGCMKYAHQARMMPQASSRQGER